MSNTILVTGTSTGIGKLTAKTLAKAGHKVIAAMRDTNSKNAGSAKELDAIDNIEVIEMDVTSDSSVESAIKKVIDAYGGIDVLVNNAGVAGFGLAEGYTIHQAKKIFEVNFFGPYRTYNAVLPSMRAAKSGLIINISTGASGFTLPFMVPYFASKFALESLVEGLALELKPYNVESVAIQSGVYPTEMTNGTKAGFGPDRADILAEYGQEATDRFNTMGGALFGKTAEFNMDPQTVAAVC
jgi:NAD(P)-dependent dehydrogenase (short-subunit alcohol dehydrogenase family)